VQSFSRCLPANFSFTPSQLKILDAVICGHGHLPFAGPGDAVFQLLKANVLVRPDNNNELLEFASPLHLTGIFNHLHPGNAGADPPANINDFIVKYVKGMSFRRCCDRLASGLPMALSPNHPSAMSSTAPQPFSSRPPSGR
jgi:hypothetical protein